MITIMKMTNKNKVAVMAIKSTTRAKPSTSDDSRRVLAKRDWLVEEMCFKYNSTRKIYMRGAIRISKSRIASKETVSAFRKWVLRIVADARFVEDIDEAFNMKPRRRKKNGSAKIRKRKNS